MFVLYNKANIPRRLDSIGILTNNISKNLREKKNREKYQLVLKSLIEGCQLLKKSKCKFLVIPCNTAHYWYEDLKKKINLPIINMPKEVYNHTKKYCKKNSSIGLLATEGTLKTGIYNKFFDQKYNLIYPNQQIQKNSVNTSIELVKMGNVKAANKKIKTAIDYLIKKKCKKIILGCTELPVAIFAFKSFNKIKTSKIFLDPNLILANAAMKKYNK